MSGAPEDGTPRASAVALVGFMGAGKSVVGRLVAKRLKAPFIDTDALIEEREGPIAAIFAARGELGFRALERDVVVQVLESALREPCVVALGGGAVSQATCCGRGPRLAAEDPWPRTNRPFAGSWRSATTCIGA